MQLGMTGLGHMGASTVRCLMEKDEASLTEITEVWRHGSVIGSWLLDLSAGALFHDQQLKAFDGRVSDSSQGRWTLMTEMGEAVPAPVLSAALYQRLDRALSSRAPTRPRSNPTLKERRCPH